VTDCRVL